MPFINNNLGVSAPTMHDILDSLETFILSIDVDCVIISVDCNVDLSRVNAHTIELMNLFNCSKC